MYDKKSKWTMLIKKKANLTVLFFSFSLSVYLTITKPRSGELLKVGTVAKFSGNSKQNSCISEIPVGFRVIDRCLKCFLPVVISLCVCVCVCVFVQVRMLNQYLSAPDGHSPSASLHTKPLLLSGLYLVWLSFTHTTLQHTFISCS